MPLIQDKPDQILTNPRPSRVGLVIPVYNEVAMLPLLREAVHDWSESVEFAIELVLVDDGSSDGSMAFLREWADSVPWVSVLSLSRNFGHQSAIYAGLMSVSSDVAVVIDADLQDPLEVIPEMVERYIEGYAVVFGVREERAGETFFKRSTAWFFYRMMRRFIHPDLPLDAGDFRLVSRPVIETLRRMPERDRFLRGMFAWMGFPQTSVCYRRQERIAGKTKYPLLKMIHFAYDAILSFSAAPIRLISLAGILTAGLGFTYGAYTVGRWFVVGDTVQGWPSIIVLICMIGGMILIGLGVVGEYVGRIYEASKSRPSFIVKEQINIAPDENE